MFENLTNKFEEIFKSLKKAPSLNEEQVDEGLRKIRQALLEADVALPVAKELIKNIKPIRYFGTKAEKKMVELFVL